MPIDASLPLFAYDHRAFVGEAVSAALAQSFDPLEVIVTDDASTDGIADEIERVLAAYSGPKRVRFIRNERKLGLARSLDAAIRAAGGAIIVGAAGDDISTPDRVRRVVEAFEADPGVRYVWSNARIVDAAGAVRGDWYDRPVPAYDLDSFRDPRTAMLGATTAFHRDAFDVSGDLVIEDRVIPMRSAVLGRLRHLPDHLVLYPRHGANASHKGKRGVADYAAWMEFRRRSAAMDVMALRCRVRDLDVAPERGVGDPARPRERAPA